VNRKRTGYSEALRTAKQRSSRSGFVTHWRSSSIRARCFREASATRIFERSSRILNLSLSSRKYWMSSLEAAGSSGSSSSVAGWRGSTSFAISAAAAGSRPASSRLRGETSRL
jgi:hypothetical protein